jgi:hypothetical protein
LGHCSIFRVNEPRPLEAVYRLFRDMLLANAVAAALNDNHKQNHADDGRYDLNCSNTTHFSSPFL